MGAGGAAEEGRRPPGRHNTSDGQARAREVHAANRGVSTAGGEAVAPNLAATTPTNALTQAAEDEKAEFVEKEKPKQGVNHSPYACFKACMPYLRSSKYGIVVNICPTETMAEAASPLHSKSGLLALTELISKSFPDIKCNAINPTVVGYSKQKKELSSEVASMVSFLTSEASPFMTGQSFTVQ